MGNTFPILKNGFRWVVTVCNFIKRSLAKLSLEQWSYVATISASVIASLTFGFGAYQFYMTQSAQREGLSLQKASLENEKEVKAVELFLRYNEIMADISSGSLNNKAALFWKYNMCLTTAESIFNLTHPDPHWHSTLVWMLESKKSHLVAANINCSTFSPGFVALMEEIVGNKVCIGSDQAFLTFSENNQQ